MSVLVVLVGAAPLCAQVKPVTRPLLRPAHFQGMRFFPSLKYRLTLGMVADTVPALADLDLDGQVDIILPRQGVVDVTEGRSVPNGVRAECPGLRSGAPAW